MAVVWCIVLPLFLCLFQICYGEQKIRLKLKFDTNKDNYRCDCKEKYVFNSKEPTKMFIENTEYLNNYKCYAETNPNQTLKTTPFLQSKHKDVWMADVVHFVLGNVICKFDYEQYKSMTCNFAVEFKYTDGLKAYINGGLLKTKRPESKEVDLEAKVLLNAKELVNIKCVKPPEVLGTLEFVYGSQYNSLNVTEEINEIEIQKIIVSEHYIHCKFLKTGGEIATVLRIAIMLRSDQEKNFIQINDLIVRPNERTTFLYMYSGHLPNITCNGTPPSVQLIETVDGPGALAECEIKDKIRIMKFFKNISCKGVLEANGESFDNLSKSDINTFTMDEGNEELILTRLYCATDSSFIYQFVTIPEELRDDIIFENLAGGNVNGHTAAIVGGILSIILVLLVGSLVVYSKRRKNILVVQQCTVNDNVNRDGLAEQLTRRQYRFDNESTKLIQDSTNSENPYSVPYSTTNITEPCYAVPGNLKGDIQYAEIGDFHRYVNRDGERAVNNNRLCETVPAYSEVGPSRPQDIYTKVLPKCQRN